MRQEAPFDKKDGGLESKSGNSADMNSQYNHQLNFFDQFGPIDKDSPAGLIDLAGREAYIRFKAYDPPPDPTKPLPRTAKTRVLTLLGHTVTLVTLAAMIACAVGIPLPIQPRGAVSKSAAEPFPCMNCPCGCRDAETCWRDCCCYTQQEKMAWARDKGVTPPAYVVAAAGREVSAQKIVCKKSKSCCQQSTKVTSCCSAQPKRSCCGNKVACTQTVTQPRQAPQRRSSTATIIQALRCQGISLSTAMLPPTVVAPPTVRPELLPLAGSAAVRDDILYDQLGPSPDTPPPQICV